MPQRTVADDEPDQLVATSPGERQRRRLEMARVACPDLLLLDEPTRDLDAASIAWLVNWIAEWRGGLLVVSHDRRVLRTFDQFFIVAESGCRHLAGSFEEVLAELGREHEENERRYLAALNRLVAREVDNAALRRRRQRKKNVGRIRELKRCPARIKLNDKRSYKQESQGKRRVLQETRIGAARDAAKASRRALSVDLPLELALPLPPKAPPTPVIICESLTVEAGSRTLFSGLSLQIGHEAPAAWCSSNGSGRRRYRGWP